MKEIPLTKGMYAIIDDENFDLVLQFNWHASGSKTSDIYYAARASKPKGTPGRIQLMQELIVGKAPEGMVTDHKNRNGLDNRKENLRFVTRRQNLLNSNAGDNFKNIYKVSGKFMVQIKYNGVLRYLGLYKTHEEAIDVRDDFFNYYDSHQ